MSSFFKGLLVGWGRVISLSAAPFVAAGMDSSAAVKHQHTDFVVTQGYTLWIGTDFFVWSGHLKFPKCRFKTPKYIKSWNLGEKDRVFFITRCFSYPIGESLIDNFQVLNLAHYKNVNVFQPVPPLIVAFHSLSSFYYPSKKEPVKAPLSLTHHLSFSHWISFFTCHLLRLQFVHTHTQPMTLYKNLFFANSVANHVRTN